MISLFRMELAGKLQYRRFVLTTRIKESDFNSLESLKKKIAEWPILKKTTFSLLPTEAANYSSETDAKRHEIEVRSKG